MDGRVGVDTKAEALGIRKKAINQISFRVIEIRDKALLDEICDKGCLEKKPRLVDGLMSDVNVTDKIFWSSLQCPDLEI